MGWGGGEKAMDGSMRGERSECDMVVVVIAGREACVSEDSGAEMIVLWKECRC
jgi:hypothetical protein